MLLLNTIEVELAVLPNLPKYCVELKKNVDAKWSPWSRFLNFIDLTIHSHCFSFASCLYGANASHFKDGPDCLTSFI